MKTSKIGELETFEDWFCKDKKVEEEAWCNKCNYVHSGTKEFFQMKAKEWTKDLRSENPKRWTTFNIESRAIIAEWIEHFFNLEEEGIERSP